MVRYIPLILKNCWRNRRRTILTILSIGVSMCLLGVMISLYHAFFLSDSHAGPGAPPGGPQQDLAGTADAAGFSAAGSSRTPGVESAMIANWFGGTYKDNRDPKNQFARFAVEPEKLFTVYSEAKISGVKSRLGSRTGRMRDRTGSAGRA
jgi:putative ABC transport system permease protein